jgi:hypothetical protein
MTIAKVEHLLRLPSMKGFEARRGLTQAAHAICSGLGLDPVEVSFHGTTRTASMSQQGALRLADIDDDSKVTRAQFVRWVGYVVHELLHRKYTSFNDVLHEIYYVRQLHNALEDAFIERTAIREGLLGNIEGLLKTLINGMVAESLTSVEDWTDTKQYPWSLAVYARGFANKVPVPVDLVPVWAEATRRIETCTSTKDCMAVAEWVYAQLLLDPEQREEIEGEGSEACDNPAPAKEGEPAEGKGTEGEGEGTPPEGEGKGDAAGDAADGADAAEGEGSDGAGKGAGKGQEDGQEGTQKAAGGDKKGAVIPDPQGDVPAAGESQRPHAYSPAVKVEPTMTGNTSLENCSGGTYNEAATVTDSPWLSHDPIHNATAVVSGKLKFEVRQLFENSGREDHQRNRRSGAVNVASLPSVATGNTRVFKRRVETAGVDSAVVLLLDISESMYGDRLIETAVAATIALGEALTAAGVDVCVALFGDDVYVLSPFGQPLKRKIDELRRVQDNRSTNDYFAVRYSHDLLLKHKAERKVLFVLTDGEGDRNTTAAQVKIGERLGITTVGVGIQREVGSVFPNNVTVNDIKALGTVAFSKIKLAA